MWSRGSLWGFVPREKETIPPAEGQVSVQTAKGTQQTILVCHSSAWLMIHPEQPGKEEVNLSSLSALAALRRKSSMWSQRERNFPSNSASRCSSQEHEPGLCNTTAGMGGTGMGQPSHT